MHRTDLDRERSLRRRNIAALLLVFLVPLFLVSGLVMLTVRLEPRIMMDVLPHYRIGWLVLWITVAAIAVDTAVLTVEIRRLRNDRSSRG